MALIYQIPRHCLAWLLISQAFLIAPHFRHIPIWILFAWIFIVAWRIQVFRGHWNFPGRKLKFVIVTSCVIGLLLEFRRWYGLEPMISLLVIAFLLKLLEMHRKRDALAVIFIAYFVASTNFLFSQTLEMTAYVLLTVIMVTTTLVALNQSRQDKSYWQTFWLAGKLVLQSIPMMAVLFVIIPRTGSLWAVPQPVEAARTGVSDTMSPGDFSRLSRSEEVAFRVTFDGEVPPNQQLYWRGLVFSDFDGRTWRQWRSFNFSDGPPVNWGNSTPLRWQQAIERAQPGLDYDVIIEPTHQNWLYALPVPEVRDENIGFTSDYRLIRRRPIGSRYRYRVTSHLVHRTDANGLDSWWRRRELQLPDAGNPRSREVAVQWRSQAGGDRAYIDRVLSHYRDNFFYTLEPPQLGEDSVDEFLWQTQRGFCEHFASSFVFMMRAAEIPARVVVGYQGGEINELENFLIVRQSDAHAWAEVWLEGQGWLRVDPTAAVAPQRIDLGLNGAISEEEAQLINRGFLGNYNHIALLNALRLRLEVLNYKWSTWVVNYDTQAQAGLLRRWLGEVSAIRIALVLLCCGALVLGSVGLWLWINGNSFKHDRGDKLYRQFLRRLRTKGLIMQAGEGPRTFAQRAARKLPQSSAWILRISQYYERYAYAGDKQALENIQRELRSMP